MRQLTAVIDRIEGNLAVLLVGDEELVLNLPLRYLPPAVEEGSVLRITFEEDRAAASSIRAQMQRRIDRLRRRGRE